MAKGTPQTSYSRKFLTQRRSFMAGVLHRCHSEGPEWALWSTNQGGFTLQALGILLHSSHHEWNQVAVNCYFVDVVDLTGIPGYEYRLIIGWRNTLNSYARIYEYEVAKSLYCTVLYSNIWSEKRYQVSHQRPTNKKNIKHMSTISHYISSNRPRRKRTGSTTVSHT